MTHPDPLDALIDDARMWRDLEVFARYVKLSGSPQERESFVHLQAEMDAAGFETTLIEHDAYISLPGAAALALEDGSESFACITHSFARATGPEGLVAEAVIVGAPTPENFDAVDLRGRIAVIDGARRLRRLAPRQPRRGGGAGPRDAARAPARDVHLQHLGQPR